MRFRKTIVALSGFSAFSALGGAVALITAPGGGVIPLDLLKYSPFSDFLIPGVLLGLVGVLSLISAVSVFRRSEFDVDTTLLAGGAMIVWIAVEIALMREFHWLQLLYGVCGVVVFALGVSGARESTRYRHRWVVIVTLAEALGFMGPAMAGLFSQSFEPAEQAMALTVAGFFEGLCLGAGQAWAFRLPLRRMRFALLTALGASLVWGSVMSTMLLGQHDANVGVMVVAGIITACVGVLAIGGFQLVALRRHGFTRRWIAWTALAWALAMPMSFLPGPLVDESTPFAAHIVIWGCGGLLMAYVMALVTWQGVRRTVTQGAHAP